MRKRHVLVCEKGWRGIRERSLDLAAQGVLSTVLIRGLADKEERHMISAHKGIKNVFIPEKFFTPFLWSYIIFVLILSRGRDLSVFLSKEKTYGRLEAFKKIFPQLELVKVYD